MPSPSGGNSFPIFSAPPNPVGPPNPTSGALNVPPATTNSTTCNTVEQGNTPPSNTLPTVPLSPSSVIYARPTTTGAPTNFYSTLQSPQPVTVHQLSLTAPGGPVVQSMAQVGPPNAPLMVQVRRALQELVAKFLSNDDASLKYPSGNLLLLR